MNPIVTSILLGLTAALANVFGGAVIVQRHWERRYLRYFIALGAGFMLATALMEMVPESLERGGKNAAFLILLGYLSTRLRHTFTLGKRRIVTSSRTRTKDIRCCSG